MRTNVVQKLPVQTTHEGARAAHISKLAELRRTVMACMLWEDQFYETGMSLATRISTLACEVPFAQAAQVAIEAREKFKLRHVPLYITACLLRAPNRMTGREMGDLIYNVIQRADEMGELLAMYWKEQPNAPLPKQMKIGLARALKKFDAYQLAKNTHNSSAIEPRDVMFLSHPWPTDQKKLAGTAPAVSKKGYHRGEVQRHFGLFRMLAENALPTPETWETMLSKGGDKKGVFEHLMLDRNLGGLAFLRNLRNMVDAKVDTSIIKEYAKVANVSRILPFRYMSAAKHARQFEPILEDMMYRSIATMDKLPGPTAILVDHSGSMEHPVSARSEVSRFEAAAAIAVLARELCDDCRVFTFSDRCIEVAPRRGFAMVDAIKTVVNPVSTYLGRAVRHIYSVYPDCQRIIVVTDEQSADRPPEPQGTGYIINVGGYKNGIGYGPWVTINGWSEAIFDYIRESEKAESELL